MDNEEIIRRITSFIENYEHNVNNQVHDLFFFYYIENRFLRNSSQSTNLLRRIFIESNNIENPMINENNTFGFIRKFPYDNHSIHTINQLVHSNFILHGNTENYRLFLAKMEGLPRTLNTYTELRNYLRNNRGAVENINIVFYEMHPDIDDDTGFEHIENVYIVRRSSSKIFFFVLMNENNEIVNISDFFSFTHSKYYIGRRHRSFLQKNFDSLAHKEPNDFHYYTNSIFEKYDENREIQRLKPLFLFLINFYNV